MRNFYKKSRNYLILLDKSVFLWYNSHIFKIKGANDEKHHRTTKGGSESL